MKAWTSRWTHVRNNERVQEEDTIQDFQFSVEENTRKRFRRQKLTAGRLTSNQGNLKSRQTNLMSTWPCKEQVSHNGEDDANRVKTDSKATAQASLQQLRGFKDHGYHRSAEVLKAGRAESGPRAPKKRKTSVTTLQEEEEGGREGVATSRIQTKGSNTGTLKPRRKETTKERTGGGGWNSLLQEAHTSTVTTSPRKTFAQKYTPLVQQPPESQWTKQHHVVANKRKKNTRETTPKTAFSSPSKGSYSISTAKHTSTTQPGSGLLSLLRMRSSSQYLRGKNRKNSRSMTTHLANDSNQVTKNKEAYNKHERWQQRKAEEVRLKQEKELHQLQETATLEQELVQERLKPDSHELYQARVKQVKVFEHERGTQERQCQLPKTQQLSQESNSWEDRVLAMEVFSHNSKTMSKTAAAAARTTTPQSSIPVLTQDTKATTTASLSKLTNPSSSLLTSCCPTNRTPSLPCAKLAASSPHLVRPAFCASLTAPHNASPSFTCSDSDANVATPSPLTIAVTPSSPYQEVATPSPSCLHAVSAAAGCAPTSTSWISQIPTDSLSPPCHVDPPGTSSDSLATPPIFG